MRSSWNGSLRERDDSAEAAFEELMIRHGPMVFGVCRRVLQDPHDAKTHTRRSSWCWPSEPVPFAARIPSRAGYSASLTALRLGPGAGLRGGGRSTCGSPSRLPRTISRPRHATDWDDSSRRSRPLTRAAPGTAGALLPRGLDLRRGCAAARSFGGHAPGPVAQARKRLRRRLTLARCHRSRRCC